MTPASAYSRCSNPLDDPNFVAFLAKHIPDFSVRIATPPYADGNSHNYARDNVRQDKQEILRAQDAQDTLASKPATILNQIFGTSSIGFGVGAIVGTAGVGVVAFIIAIALLAARHSFNSYDNDCGTKRNDLWRLRFRILRVEQGFPLEAQIETENLYSTWLHLIAGDPAKEVDLRAHSYGETFARARRVALLASLCFIFGGIVLIAYTVIAIHIGAPTSTSVR